VRAKTLLSSDADIGYFIFAVAIDANALGTEGNGACARSRIRKVSRYALKRVRTSKNSCHLRFDGPCHQNGPYAELASCLVEALFCAKTVFI
jgi:hypothetical protein